MATLPYYVDAYRCRIVIVSEVGPIIKLTSK